MSDLISRLSLKDRASEYALSADEYKRLCKIIDTEPTAYSVDNDGWQGGASGEMCEWKLDDDNLITSCGDYFNLYDNCTEKFKYCPRCGRKIKVVEWRNCLIQEGI